MLATYYNTVPANQTWIPKKTKQNLHHGQNRNHAESDFDKQNRTGLSHLPKRPRIKGYSFAILIEHGPKWENHKVKRSAIENRVLMATEHLQAVLAEPSVRRATSMEVGGSLDLRGKTSGLLLANQVRFKYHKNMNNLLGGRDH